MTTTFSCHRNGVQNASSLSSQPPLLLLPKKIKSSINLLMCHHLHLTQLLNQKLFQIYQKKQLSKSLLLRSQLISSILIHILSILFINHFNILSLSLLQRARTKVHNVAPAQQPTQVKGKGSGFKKMLFSDEPKPKVPRFPVP